MKLLFAFLLDLLLGDPERWPHPVRWIGRMIAFFERLLRRLFPGKERFSGILLLLIICIPVYLFTFAAVFGAGLIHPFLGLCVEIFLIYLTLSVKSLGSSALEVMHHLKQGNLEAARSSVSKIVGRDTENMTETEVVRASVETVAENTVDGIISPLFFAFLGGAPLAMMFKAVSTLDSMVGYKSERYKDFGWASARFDDVLNWIPARVCYFLVPVAAWFLRMKASDSFKLAIRDGKKHPSPNSGIAEATFAGALGIQLGGTNYRKGQAVEYPSLGNPVKGLEINDIQDAVRLSWLVSWIWLFILLLTTVLIS